MSLHEVKKGCKILDEVILFLMKNGHLNLDIKINKDEKVLSLEIKTKKASDSLIKEMDEYINRERELEVEEYGWELMGESDCENGLELIGLLVDKLEIFNDDESSTTFRLTRVDKY